MMRSLPVMLLIACGDPAKGTAVGNPGKLQMAADLPPDSTLESGSFDVAALMLQRPGRGGPTIIDFAEPFDLVNPADIEFPGGEWEVAVVLPDGETPLHLNGVDGEGAPFEQHLPVDDLVFEGEFFVDGDEVVISLAVRGSSFQDAAAGEPDTGNDPPETNDNEGVRGGALNVGGNGLYLDGDRDGVLEEDELSAVAAPDSGKSCSTAPVLAWLTRR